MTEMKKHIYDENNGLWYELIGDYYIPVFTLSSEEQRPIGKWGRMHRDYLREHRPLLFNDLILSGQMIEVNASDGSSRLSLNTCQACSPSPRAYFKEENGRLVCQNCGNVFTMDSVGEAAGGCNPMNIAYNVEDKNLTVNAADLDRFAGNFASWSGPVE